VQLAAALGMDCVAEGVETEAQRALLLDRGCTYGQGYLFARPMPASQITAILSGCDGLAARPDTSPVPGGSLRR
jgi:EAL domain-containing protein (putative c-di-GMP-specific phosphodiesterase class I)